MCIRDRSEIEGLQLIGSCRQGQAESVVDGRMISQEARAARQAYNSQTSADWAVSYTHLDVYKRQLVDESVMFAFMLAAIVFCLGQIIEYGYLVQDENFEII